jgi:RND family efflux transporter MFP subunit
MGSKYKNLIKNISNLFGEKPLLAWPALGVLVVLGGIAIFSSNGNGKYETIVISPKDFVQEVSVSGKVVASENTDLSFEQGGRVVSIPVKVGQKVKAGTLLASQDTSELSAEYTEMQAGIDVQKAKLEQLLSGSSAEDIQIAETAVANAKVSVNDYKEKLIDKIQDAYTRADDAVRGKSDQLFSSPSSSNPQLSLNAFVGASLESELESMRVSLSSILNTWSLDILLLSSQSELTSITNSSKNNLQEIKTFLDKISFVLSGLTPNSNLTQTTIDGWKADISTARTNVNTAIINLTSAETDLKTAQGSLVSAENQLSLKKAPARSADISLYEAQIRQAEAVLQGVAARLYKKQIRAPFNGVITAVHGKIGNISPSNEPVVSVISDEALQIESYVPEIKIPLVEVGDEALITFDAFGDEKVFTAKVVSIDPAETIRDGISTYRIKLDFVTLDSSIRSGMSSNVLITTESKSGVISIPQGIVKNKNGKKIVEVLRNGDTEEVVVETGSVSSLGEIEILSGLKRGDVVLVK